MLSLVASPGQEGEKTFPLPLGKVTIGRTKDNGIYYQHKSLSRRHAEVECDGMRILITDLASKNGVIVDGRRVKECERRAGDEFRCGDVRFFVKSATARVLPPAHLLAHTLPSPADEAITERHEDPVTITASDRAKNKLFLLIRATEFVACGHPTSELVEELAILASQALSIDRIAVLIREGTPPELKLRVTKTNRPEQRPEYSQRVTQWAFDHASATSFADVACDNTLGGDSAADAGIRAAAGVPINAGRGIVGVLYADSLTVPDIFRPDDMAVLRAFANLIAVAIALGE
ncbi:MAG: FHA domain-containing protein [Polyangiaceae bacterium]|nr:FHA domain-containing protein [Polyangiaceae bacterium]